MSIVIIKDGDAVTTTLAIAEGTLNDHASVIALTRKYQSDLEDFGEVRFEIRLNPQGSPTEFAILNEPQSTLLLTFMRNTDIVRAFKKKLVREFWEMVQQRNQRGPALPADYKYPITREGDPIMLAEERTASFGANWLSVRACSPTVEDESRIEKSFLASDQRRASIQCPGCGHRQFPDFFKHVHWQKDQETGAHKPKTARMYCEGCGAEWSEGDRLKSLRSIRWHQTKTFSCCGERHQPLEMYDAAWNLSREGSVAGMYGARTGLRRSAGAAQARDRQVQRAWHSRSDLGRHADPWRIHIGGRRHTETEADVMQFGHLAQRLFNVVMGVVKLHCDR